MKKQDVLALLTNLSEDFPREALEEVRSKRIDITTELLESLDYANQNAEKLFEESSGYFLYNYAMFLLAEFREKSAFPKLAAFLQQPQNYIEFLLSDTLTEDFPRILCSTFDGRNIKMLTDVIENQELYEYARSAAISAYTMLYEEGFVTEEEYISYFRSLIHNKNKLASDESYAATTLVNCIQGAKLTQMLTDVLFLYDNDYVDTFAGGQYDSFLGRTLSDKKEEEAPHYIDNAIQAMEG